jgi:hypothetical protein
MTSHHGFFTPFFCGTDGEWAELQDRLVIDLRQYSCSVAEKRNKLKAEKYVCAELPGLLNSMPGWYIRHPSKLPKK